LSANTPNAIPEKPRPVRGFSFLTSWHATRTDALVCGVVLGALFIAALAAMRHRGSYTDELDHFAQVQLFLRGEWRVIHTLTTLVRQRVFQIACGYADQDDADTLRSNPRTTGPSSSGSTSSPSFVKPTMSTKPTVIG